MSFEVLKDQPKVLNFFKNVFASHRLPHALLFAGSSGAGQRDAAIYLASALFCAQKKGSEPCGACPNCKRVALNAHPDFFILEPSDHSQFIKVEEIRDLKTQASFKPLEASAKVFVIDPADAMNDAAQNALLKTLEEPEGHSIFILITSAIEKMLVTVRSRTQTVHFLPRPKNYEEDVEFAALKREALAYLEAVDDHPSRAAAIKTPDFLRLERESLVGLLDVLIDYFREVLILRAGAGEMLGFVEERASKEKSAGLLDEDALIDRIELLSEFKEKVSENVSLKLALNVLWDEIVQRKKAYVS